MAVSYRRDASRTSGQVTIRWGVIGCGAVCEVKSLPALQLTPGFVVAGVTRRDQRAARAFAERHHVARVFASPEALIADPDIDAVYIATPPAAHLGTALAVADAGKPCCVEKPMTVSGADSGALVRAFEQAGKPLFVAYYRRMLPRFRRLKTWLESGAIGTVRAVHWQLNRPPSETDLDGSGHWRTDPNMAGGGYFVDLASHGLDLLQFLLGDIEQVTGVAVNQQGLYSAEDAVAASFAFASGPLGTGQWNFGADERVDELEFIGSTGRITCSVLDEHPLRLTTRTDRIEQWVANPRHVQLYHAEAMARHLAGLANHPSCGADALKTDRVLDAILGR
ncbi:MAG: Gfo/Idh/MocA family oxidoreductase [Pseudomonadota bacterium]